MLNTHTLVKDLVSAGLAEKVAIILGDAISASTKEYAEKIEKEQIGIKTDLIILKETAAKKVDVVKLESDLVTKDFFEQKIEASNDKFERKMEALSDKFEQKFDELKALIAAQQIDSVKLESEIRGQMAKDHKSTIWWIVGLFVTTLIFTVGLHFK